MKLKHLLKETKTIDPNDLTDDFFENISKILPQLPEENEEGVIIDNESYSWDSINNTKPFLKIGESDDETDNLIILPHHIMFVSFYGDTLLASKYLKDQTQINIILGQIKKMI